VAPKPMLLASRIAHDGFRSTVLLGNEVFEHYDDSHVLT
jgi:hypothetical protein